MRVERHTFPHPEAEALLRGVVWGSEGGVRYQALDAASADAFGEHHLLVAYDGAVLAGLVVLHRLSIGWLIQLFAVEPSRVGTGVGRALVEHMAGLPLDAPAYGTIEETNHRSLAMLGTHCPHQRVLEVLTFSRRWPRRSACCRTDAVAFLDGLPSAGRTNEPSTVDPTRAYVVERDGQRAGVLLVPHCWRLRALPGAQQALLPLLPLLLGTTAARYRFGMFHCWWGPVELYDELWTHALADQGLSSGLATGDVESPLWADLRSTVPRGVLGRLAGLQRMIVPSTGPLPGPMSFGPAHAL